MVRKRERITIDRSIDFLTVHHTQTVIRRYFTRNFYWFIKKYTFLKNFFVTLAHRLRSSRHRRWVEASSGTIWVAREPCACNRMGGVNTYNLAHSEIGYKKGSLTPNRSPSSSVAPIWACRRFHPETGKI